MKNRSNKGRGRPAGGQAMTAAERMRRYRARRKAAGLRPVVRWEPTTGTTFSSHRLLDARSLALHCLIARKLLADPATVVAAAGRNIRRWRQQASGAVPDVLDEWEKLLQLPPLQLAALLTEQSENAVRLRQSSPFAGALSPVERRRIYDAFRA